MNQIGLLFLRIAFAGTMLVAHGYGKLIGFAEIAPTFPDPLHVGATLSLGLTIFAEFFCSIAVIVGFQTRYTVFPLIATMAVAFFKIHSQDPFMKKELALVYLFGFVSILLLGPGKHSLDRR